MTAPTAADVQSGMRRLNGHAATAPNDTAIWCPDVVPATDPLYYCSDASTGVGVRSTHRGGSNISFADGSTRFLDQSIDLMIWYQMHTIQGGESFGDF